MAAVLSRGRSLPGSIRALVLGLVAFPVALATHEVMHLAVYSALGYRAVLVVTQWRLGTGGPAIFGLHAAVAGPAPALPVLVANNFLGPALAAVLLLALLAPARDGPLRAALLGNVLGLAFFALIEPGYPLLEEVAHVQADVLLLPEVDYGVVLLLLVASSLAPARRTTS